MRLSTRLLFLLCSMLASIPADLLSQTTSNAPLIDALQWVTRDGDDYIIGRLTNNSAVPLTNVRVQLSLYSISGTLVGQTGNLGRAGIDIIPPATKWLFSCWIPSGLIFIPAYAKDPVVSESGGRWIYPKLARVPNPKVEALKASEQEDEQEAYDPVKCASVSFNSSRPVMYWTFDSAEQAAAKRYDAGCW